jgi:hypothetical protein
MSPTAHIEATRSMCREWLAEIGATAEQVETVTDDVVSRLAELPSVLGLGARAVGLGFALLPHGVRNLPIASEYRRLVHSLAAVSYFDLVSRSAAMVPAPRSGGAPTDAPLAEKLA